MKRMWLFHFFLGLYFAGLYQIATLCYLWIPHFLSGCLQSFGFCNYWSHEATLSAFLDMLSVCKSLYACVLSPQRDLQQFHHLSDDRESESVLCRLVLFISLVMKSLWTEQWAVMPNFNMDLGSSAKATQRQTNAQTDGSQSISPAPIMYCNYTHNWLG